VVDIETTPHLAFVWQTFKTTVSPIMLLQESYVLSYSAKWLDEDQTITRGLCDFPSYEKRPEDDKHLIKELIALLDVADVVVGHNINKFDLAVINARALKHGLKRPTPYKVVDTLAAARKFKVPFRSLAGLAELLDLADRKGDAGGLETWIKIIRDRDPKAWKLMLTYNEKDVKVTEQLYYRLRPWITNLPISPGLIYACPDCESGDFTLTRRRTVEGKTIHRCKECDTMFTLTPSGKPKKI
jgi:hypothetical protein